MHYLRWPLQAQPAVAGLIALASLLGGLRAVAEPQTSDPVEQVRLSLPILISPGPEELQFRKEALARAIPNLTTPGELRRALQLIEWADEDPRNQELATVDREARTRIGKKLVKWIADAAESSDPTRQVAAATLAGQIGSSIRAVGQTVPVIEVSRSDPNGFGRSLEPYLIDMIQKKNRPKVRQEAARALAKVNPEPKKAVEALDALLHSGDASDREAASEALGTMASNVTQLWKTGRAQSGVYVKRDDVLHVAEQVVPVAGLFTQDPDPVVRRNSLTALVNSANSFNDLIPNPNDVNKIRASGRPFKYLSESEQRTIKEFNEVVQVADQLFPKLIKAFEQQGTVLAAALSDRDEEARILARRALEWIASVRLELLALPKHDAGKAGKADEESADPLMKALAPGLKYFSKRLISDPDVQVRRASLDFLEPMEDALLPAVPALTQALGDEDRFIRWAAARTLGKIGEKNIAATAAQTAPALGRLVTPDNDPDVRDAASRTLRIYGAAGRPALPFLLAFVGDYDLEARDSAIKAIQAVAGPKALEAVAAVRNATFSTDSNVRRAAAEALGSFGAAARPAEVDLQRLLTDDDPAVRTGASEALLQITQPPQR